MAASFVTHGIEQDKVNRPGQPEQDRFDGAQQRFDKFTKGAETINKEWMGGPVADHPRLKAINRRSQPQIPVFGKADGLRPQEAPANRQKKQHQ